MLKLKNPLQINIESLTDGRGGAYANIGLFIAYFQEVPNRIRLGKVDSRQYREWFEKNYAELILDRRFLARRLEKDSRLAEEDDIYYFLRGERMLYIDTNRDAISLLFLGEADELITELHEAGARLGKEQADKFYINLIGRAYNGFHLDQMEIKRTDRPLSLHYNDDFLPIHHRILKRLNIKNDKGIVLLHGKPGTGKTSYIRYLIGQVDKDVIFLPPAMAGALTEPGLISILTENPNSIFVIEDAENILVGRDQNKNSPVSTLLNISDGLLADCLNIQIICSFNTDLSNIDRALLRKGRLIAKYNFEELSLAKSRSLGEHLNYPAAITRPMVLSELYHPEDLDYSKPQKQAIGF